MTTASDMKGRYALTTGGSSGIGAAIADELAGHKANLVLVAHDAEQLEKTAAALPKRHGIAVLSVALALDEPGAPRRLVEIVRRAGADVEMLVNKAARACGRWWRTAPPRGCGNWWTSMSAP
ncbi:SDR family NAD(P)-dependent oxidoreductase [Micromonospora sp. WMMD956]|uniref:SDR family NAD(P)-dependent oxidoreductase n=1 Tax=Micromonospora sp. WMMD956 TaxID=3016108 RepID=UPI002415BA68|nr:SDR family NAD(P)-dependent oxidoreductase [Micromonospora sp. WMMD956]MDG4814828.1 SDR family NAD(P)-dependent oxidoreductase [Micromonospora sp. WMMD956]